MNRIYASMVIVGVLCLSVAYVVSLNALSIEISKNTMQSQTIVSLNEENGNLTQTVEGLRSENQNLSRLELKRPNLVELQAFLNQDSVHRNNFNIATYNCMNFARDLKLDATVAGWNVSYVQVNYVVFWQGKEYGDDGHSINGVYLDNGTFLYIEPQNNLISQSLLPILQATEPTAQSIQVQEVIVVW